MAEPVRRPATWADLERLPEDVRAEILAGEILIKPRPQPSHSHAHGALLGSVMGPFSTDPGGPGGWWILLEPDVRLGPHEIVEPDIAGWRKEKVPVFFDRQPIEIAPDWSCEILSPSTARFDRAHKSELYLKSGVGHYWLVDVEARVLEAYEARGGQWLRLGAWSDGDRQRIAPFEAIESDVSRHFPPPAN